MCEKLHRGAAAARKEPIPIMIERGGSIWHSPAATPPAGCPRCRPPPPAAPPPAPSARAAPPPLSAAPRLPPASTGARHARGCWPAVSLLWTQVSYAVRTHARVGKAVVRQATRDSRGLPAGRCSRSWCLSLRLAACTHGPRGSDERPRLHALGAALRSVLRTGARLAEAPGPRCSLPAELLLLLVQRFLEVPQLLVLAVNLVGRHV